MPALALAFRLRSRAQKDLAFAQDLAAAAVYDVFPSAVLHGGTAIWRCYGGNRFSGDLDFYLPKSAGGRFELVSRRLESDGLEREKVKRTERAIFASFRYQRSAVSLEAVLRERERSVTRPFETLNGGYFAVRTLPPEGLLAEKAAAYSDRRKVRDLYDVFSLLPLVKTRDEAVSAVEEMLTKYKKPIDENSLKALVLSGVAPRAEEMKEAIQDWAR
ncbi:MAG: nucleotidyl transferase AbiEii/AbiGii toxin family protein [archaeon]|nr:MAG: nucleotidyl transferase AbiEii/AbiGii toxin family protein [archaeon]